MNQTLKFKIENILTINVIFICIFLVYWKYDKNNRYGTDGETTYSELSGQNKFLDYIIR